MREFKMIALLLFRKAEIIVLISVGIATESFQFHQPITSLHYHNVGWLNKSKPSKNK
jgi:hypothetical protein